MAKENNESDPSHLKTIPHERKEDRPDFSEPLPKAKLPEEIQKTLDSDERLWDILTSGKGEDSTESNLRYAAYANRIRTIMLSAHRYVAYTSDIGESFRPVAHPWLVRGAYGVSWAYLIGDVSHEGYKAYKRNQRILHPETDPNATTAQLQTPGHVPAIDDYRARMAERAVFQGLASMGLPAFTIHSIVRYSGQAFKNVKNVKVRTWGPIGLGLAAVPALPYMFDHLVEVATEWVFHKGFELVGGPAAVGKDPITGMSTRVGHTRPDGEKEKEL
jgi:fission process protein 1